MTKSDGDEHLAKEFATFFLEKIEKIRDNLDRYPRYSPDHRDVPLLESFRPMPLDEILSIIMEMPTKHCDLDPVPFLVLKKTGTTNLAHNYTVGKSFPNQR